MFINLVICFLGFDGNVYLFLLDFLFLVFVYEGYVKNGSNDFLKVKVVIYFWYLVENVVFFVVIDGFLYVW